MESNTPPTNYPGSPRPLSVHNSVFFRGPAVINAPQPRRSLLHLQPMSPGCDYGTWLISNPGGGDFGDGIVLQCKFLFADREEYTLPSLKKKWEKIRSNFGIESLQASFLTCRSVFCGGAPVRSSSTREPLKGDPGDLFSANPNFPAPPEGGFPAPGGGHQAIPPWV